MTLTATPPLSRPKPPARPVPMHPPGRTGFAPMKVDYDDFLAMRGLPHDVFEYVDGYAVEMPMASLNHVRLRTWLLRTGDEFAETTGYGTCDGEPFAVVLPNGNSRMPDVFFWPKAQDAALREHALHGPADLVIEILSPSTKKVDYGPKFLDYQSAGCREYWLLDPERPKHDFFALENGQFVPRLPEVEADGTETIRSAAVSGLWFKLDWFTARPPAGEVMAAWDLR